MMPENTAKLLVTSQQSDVAVVTTLATHKPVCPLISRKLIGVVGEYGVHFELLQKMAHLFADALKSTRLASAKSPNRDAHSQRVSIVYDFWVVQNHRLVWRYAIGEFLNTR